MSESEKEGGERRKWRGGEGVRGRKWRKYNDDDDDDN